MNKVLKYIISNILICISGMVSVVACTLGFNNSSQNTTNYLNNLLNNPYESLIIEPSNYIGELSNDPFYHKELESQIGLYSMEEKMTIDSIEMKTHLVKCSDYTNDKQYNSFGVLSSIIGGTKHLWTELTDGKCFVSREMAINYSNKTNKGEADIIGKTIICNDTELLVAGVYYTNTNSNAPEEMQSKGNIFSLCLENTIFVSNDFSSESVRFNSFLYLLKNSKINSIQLYTSFEKACLNSSAIPTIKDKIGTYHLDSNIVDKINSVRGFYSTLNIVICILLLHVSFGLFLVSLFFSKKSKMLYYNSNPLKNVLLIILPLGLMVLGLFVIKVAFFKTKSGLKIIWNNPAAIAFYSILFFLFFAVTLWEVFRTYLKEEQANTRINEKQIDTIRKNISI